ncbi:MAG: carboxymuconolactone decarboxylase family protein [Acidimicrobiia bacterium]|nr:carboxymuconolactone decarboxylase family protein [Acidimicrobiia bacterium]
MAHQSRMSIQEVAPEARRAVLHLTEYVRGGGIDEGLHAMVDIRASQINNCAWCLDMHTAEALAAGVDQRRINLVAAWREAGSLFSEREQAALALTEAVTLISADGVPDRVWDDVTAAFDEKEVVVLLMAICTINVWNRLNVTVRTELPDEPFVP